MDIRQQVTDTLVTLMEEGASSHDVLWDATVANGLPVNHETQTPYSGVNVLTLCGHMYKFGYTSNEWLTVRQANALGGWVRKGSKGALCVYYKKRAVESKEGDLATVPLIAPFTLFNIDQIEGLDIPAVVQGPDFDPIERAEQVLDASGALINWQGARAFYRPCEDRIYLPDRSRFISPTNAYAVALHELANWTGHESRLNRTFGAKYQDNAYAFEELVAELTAAYLVVHLGLKGAKLEHHASYLAHYLTIMKSDKGAIFTASRLAGQAFTLITDLAKGEALATVGTECAEVA